MSVVTEDGQDNVLDPTDPYERQAQTFPRLTAGQIERIGRFGDTGDYPAGTQLFRRGDRSVDFFVVVEGSVKITDAGTDGRRWADGKARLFLRRAAAG